jgi:hypothetical protein
LDMSYPGLRAHRLSLFLGMSYFMENNTGSHHIMPCLDVPSPQWM